MVDITIRGAGIFGLSIAWACVRRGARVQVIDPHGPGAGSSGGLVGALAPHVPENWNPKKAFQLESLLMGETFWTEIKQTGGLDPGYIRSGRLQPIADEAGLALARRRAETAAELWAGQATWRIEPQPEDLWTPQSPSGWVIRDTLSALVHPRHAIAALVAALRSRGATITTEAADRGAVIWATGTAGLDALSDQQSRRVGNGVKGQAALLAHDARGAPQLFSDGIHIIPHLDGTVAVGSTSERDFESPKTTDAQLDAVIDKARAAVPILKTADVVDRWAGVRPRARTRAPMLGPWPERPGHFIANGGFKIGFGMAPKISEVMADLILEDRDQIPKGFEVTASL
ncbi:MAG: FAD-dependent oxidoreductase [Roseobacter sp.]|jgi:glycine oxidase